MSPSTRRYWQKVRKLDRLGPARLSSAQIAAQLGISPASAKRHEAALKKAGRLIVTRRVGPRGELAALRSTASPADPHRDRYLDVPIGVIDALPGAELCLLEALIWHLTVRPEHELSTAELLRQVGIASRTAAATHLRRLEALGLIDREHRPGRAPRWRARWFAGDPWLADRDHHTEPERKAADGACPHCGANPQRDTPCCPIQERERAAARAELGALVGDATRADSDPPALPDSDPRTPPQSDPAFVKQTVESNLEYDLSRSAAGAELLNARELLRRWRAATGQDDTKGISAQGSGAQVLAPAWPVVGRLTDGQRRALAARAQHIIDGGLDPARLTRRVDRAVRRREAAGLPVPREPFPWLRAVLAARQGCADPDCEDGLLWHRDLPCRACAERRADRAADRRLAVAGADRCRAALIGERREASDARERLRR
jgi:DNA-binding MarR family transcriptional regulator